MNNSEAPPQEHARETYQPPRKPFLRLRPVDVTLYRTCDYLSGPVILSVLVFGPLAFGTTQAWSVSAMNCAGYAAGFLLLLKLWIRTLKGYRPARWGGGGGRDSFISAEAITGTLAGLTLAILAYCLVSAVNASATWHPAQLQFQYHDHIKWLPHSLDSAQSWSAFQMYLGLACTFWAIRDWVLGKSDAEQIPGTRDSKSAAGSALPMPARLRTLLWVLAINGAALGIEGIAQRIEGSGRLLFLVKPRVNPGADTQFGPWAYRSNAAQYFNLLWPVCLGFWWTLNRGFAGSRRYHHWLLVCAAIMAVCPLMSNSRGGAIVTGGIILFSAFFLTASHFLVRASSYENRKSRMLTLCALGLFFAVTLVSGMRLGWKSLGPRMQEIDEGFIAREEMYALAKPMARDYPLYGTGPGTFASVFQLYRPKTSTYWPAQLHNDWLETRITFGWIGSVLILLALLCPLVRWFAPGGIHGGRRFGLLAYMALGGSLAHARFDFPFQIHSVLMLFLVICAILMVVSLRPRTL